MGSSFGTFLILATMALAILALGAAALGVCLGTFWLTLCWVFRVVAPLFKARR